MKYFTLTLLVFFCYYSVAQNGNDNKEEKIHLVADTMPEFVGGQLALFDYLAHNITYPADAKAENVEGKVFINFIVTSDGNIKDAKVLKAVHPSLDKEALRVINSMPKWNPGVLKGKKIAVSFNLPISFKLGSLDGRDETEVYEEGNKHFSLGEYEKAIEKYSYCIKQNPVFIDAYYNRGVCYFKSGNTEKACKDWTSVKNLGDHSVKELLEKHCQDYSKTIPRTLPEFPGGVSAQSMYQIKHMNLPNWLKTKKGVREVIIDFVVEKDGTLSDIKITSNSDVPEYDAIALEMVKSMPKWTPGTINGEPESMSYTMPIRYEYITYEEYIAGKSTGPSLRAEKYYNKGKKFYDKKAYNKAINQYNEAIKWYEGYHDAYYLRGLCHFELDDKLKACKDWQKAVSLGSTIAQKMVNEKCK